MFNRTGLFVRDDRLVVISILCRGAFFEVFGLDNDDAADLHERGRLRGRAGQGAG